METNEQRPINDFSSAIEAALKAIREKDFEQAAILASLAYDLAPDPSEQARAARDLSTTYRHLNKYDEAEEWVTKVYVHIIGACLFHCVQLFCKF